MKGNSIRYKFKKNGVYIKWWQELLILFIWLGVLIYDLDFLRNIGVFATLILAAVLVNIYQQEAEEREIPFEERELQRKKNEKHLDNLAKEAIKEVEGEEAASKGNKA